MEAEQTTLDSGKNKLPTKLALGAVLAVGVAGVVVVTAWFRPQNLTLTPRVEVQRTGAGSSVPCVAGRPCAGPTLSAQDPEGEQVTYRFYDKATGKPVGEPIKAESGKPVTPEFKFSDSGEKQLYLVVEDGAGHTSVDYPIIIPVE